MDTLGKYDKLVIKALLAQTKFVITEINNLETIKATFFIEEQYSKIISWIKERNWENISSIDNKVSNITEYLDIISFADQSGETYVATIYDSNELWQDPEVMHIFPLFK